jgi:hypothetical protein
MLKARIVKPAETAVARQQLRNMTQRSNWEGVFSMRSVPRLHTESIWRCKFGSWKPVSSAWELQLKGASQRGQEPFDTEADDATPLEAAIRQRSEDSD